MAEPLIIGVSGGSASGKTEIARATARAAKPMSTLVLAEDDYYGDHGSAPGFEAARFNFDDPAARDHALLAEQLTALKAGERVEAPVYDFTIHRRRGDTRTIRPADVIIVEGIHLFADARLRAAFDLRVFVDAPDDIRLARRLLRDVNERGRTAQSVVAQYLGTVRPMHHAWTLPTRDHAHIVIRNDSPAATPSDGLQTLFEHLAHPVIETLAKMKASNSGQGAA